MGIAAQMKSKLRPMAAELQTRIGFAAGLGASAKQPDAAKALIGFLSAPAAAATLKAKGVEPRRIAGLSFPLPTRALASGGEGVASGA